MSNKYSNKDYQYDDKGYRLEKFGLNQEKWTKSNPWTEYEEYHNKHNDKKYQRRYFNISHADVEDYLRFNDNFLECANIRGQSWQSLIANTKSSQPFRLQETLNPTTGSKAYSLQYKGNYGWTEYASGYENQSGSRTTNLSKLTPEELDRRKSKGYGPISQFSSWFDMTPQQRKEYNREEWINTPFQTELRIDKEGNRWSGWAGSGTGKSELHHVLRDEHLRSLPQNIIRKYNLVGKDYMRMSPYDGEIYFTTSTGSHRKTVSQEDMK